MQIDLFLQSKIEIFLNQGKTIAYLDEVGRGAIFGQLVVGCVILKKGFFHPEIDDSKNVKPEIRRKLSKIILKNVVDYQLTEVQVDEINVLRNIGTADKLAMIRAVKGLKQKPDILFIDGPIHLGLGIEEYAIIGGDRKIFGIACASIIAKHYRDKIMKSIGNLLYYSKYDIGSCKGYKSPHHLMAIRKYGLTNLHRSYMPLVQRVINGNYDEVIESKYLDRYAHI
jgi:ribonuclease HII